LRGFLSIPDVCVGVTDQIINAIELGVYGGSAS
jgi:hypothetical protein